MDLNENWQKEAPTLAAMEKINPFSVPDEYFEQMQNELQSRIVINQIDNGQAYFDVPANYFDTLADRITSVNNLEVIKTQRSTTFSAPDDYFDNLEGRIFAKIASKNQPVSKIRRIASSWITYAAAACITAIISFGIYYNSKNTDIENQIAKLPADEIVHYLQLYSDAGDAPLIIKSLGNETELSDLHLEVSEQEIEQYLELNL